MLCVSLLVLSLSEHSLSSCFVPGIDPGTGNARMLGTRICPQGTRSGWPLLQCEKSSDKT